MTDARVPQSLEGWWVLHRMFRFDRGAWDALPEKRRAKYAAHASDLFEHLQSGKDGDAGLAQLLGYRGDLMLTHYARSYEGLAYAQTLVDKLEFREYLDSTNSYVSVIEMERYESANGEQPERNVSARLWAKIPRRRYVCFYVMRRRREGQGNWYLLPFEERARLAASSERIVRVQQSVTQVISGSIGFDDYEWGVDLYADDAGAFKKLLQEQRFDEASARYGDFGASWSGVQFSTQELRVFLDGDAVPGLDAPG